MTPRTGEDDINAPRRPLGATACSMAIAALVPFPVFFEGPRVCLGGAVVAASVIMMGRGKNGQALKEVTKIWWNVMHCLVFHVCCLGAFVDLDLSN